MITTLVMALGLLAGAWWMTALRTLPRGSFDERRSISVVVPARNEALSLPALLGSLAACDHVVAEVIVVDDASSDDTSTIAADNGAVVLRLDGGPPHGWTGKAYACARGAETATSDLLLFLDADVTLSSDSIDRLLAAHARHGGLITVQPHHRVERPYESLSAVCNVVALMGTGAFVPWPRPRRVAAFGPCMLTTVDDYLAVGGHSAVRDEVIEDLQLARRYQSVGLPVSVYAGGDAVSFRMYPDGLRQLIDGWSKSLAAGSRLVSPTALLVGVWWVTACLVFAGRGVDAVLHAGSIGSGDALLAAAGWLAVTIEMAWLLRKVGTFRWPVAVLHPVPIVAFIALFARSAWLTFVRRRVHWRGRDVAISADRQV